MIPYSRRHNLKEEFSGHGEASANLRNRLLQLYGHPFSGNESHFGLGNTNWIHQGVFSKDLQMHFGKRIPLEDFRNDEKTSYDDIFDFIELYYARAQKDINSTKRTRLHVDIAKAFINSGSVYKFNSEGQVDLKIDDAMAENITKVDIILNSLDNAQKIYRECVDGLISRSKKPQDIVKDMHVVFEDYLKKITEARNSDMAIQRLREKDTLHATQFIIIEKLKAYRGYVWGAAHAGNSPMPDERDALWYLESVIAQIKYIDSKTKQDVG